MSCTFPFSTLKKCVMLAFFSNLAWLSPCISKRGKNNCSNKIQSEKGDTEHSSKYLPLISVLFRVWEKCNCTMKVIRFVPTRSFSSRDNENLYGYKDISCSPFFVFLTKWWNGKSQKCNFILQSQWWRRKLSSICTDPSSSNISFLGWTFEQGSCHTHSCHLFLRWLHLHSLSCQEQEAAHAVNMYVQRRVRLVVDALSPRE